MRLSASLLAALLIFSACATTTSRDFIAGPQGRLHINDGGRGGLPVVFVHGNGANLEQWRAQLAHVRKERRAVALDLRGMGKSDPARNGDYSVAGMAEDVDAVANALGLQRFAIVGHSYGGAVVAMYAARHPDRVAGVVFADSAGNIKVTDKAANAFTAAIRADKDKVVRPWFGPILKGSSDAVRNEVFASVHDASTDAFVGALSGMRDIDMKALLDAYRGPRLAIAAADIESPSSLHQQFPSLPVKKMHGTGHWLMLDKPDEFNALLDEFLRTMH